MFHRNSLIYGYHPLMLPTQPVGRILTSDWSVNSFLMLVYEKNYVIVLSLEKSD